jgi:hypothetical protein
VSNGSSSEPRVTTLVRPEPSGRLARLPSRDLQELWFATLRTPWRTLALVPAQDGLSIKPLAEALALMGQFHRGVALRVVIAEGMDLNEIAELTLSTQEPPAGGQSGQIIVLEPITVNPLGTAVALAADAVLLCVEYGTANLDDARRTLDQIGRERFVGCAVLMRE